MELLELGMHNRQVILFVDRILIVNHFSKVLLYTPVQGILQPDMWNVVPSDRWNWPAIRGMISKVGLRNSLLVAPMPTASTSQILGNNECFEPYTSNIYSRRVLRFAYLLLVLFIC
jgi:hypothetical protein